MEFQVLGPVRVIPDEGPQIRLGSAEQRRLTSLLALHAGSVVMADLLSDKLGLSPGALRTSISRLRRALGSDVLVTAPPGYLLRTRDVDARKFEDVIRIARARDAWAAISLYKSALGLWRGEAYAEFSHELWAMAESRRLEELRSGAVEHLAELLLAQHEFAEAVAYLEPMISKHPFRDRPRSLLIRALAESGRRVDALRAFQAYRTFLAQEVGTEPSSEFVALENEIVSEALNHVVTPRI
jgi:DNA-binding SARP family transcriptional activator